MSYFRSGWIYDDVLDDLDDFLFYILLKKLKKWKIFSDYTIPNVAQNIKWQNNFCVYIYEKTKLN